MTGCLARACSVAVAAAIACLASPPGWAQPRADDQSIEKAKEYFEAGKQAYGSGQYKVAITAFEEAYRLAPRSAIVFSLAQAFRRQYFVDSQPEHVAAALLLYRQYLNEVPSGGRRNDAVEHIQTLEPILRSLKASGALTGNRRKSAPAATQLMVTSKTKGARASIGGGELSEVPVTRDVKPGKHKIRVEAPGHFPQDSEGIAVDGRLILVSADLRPMPATILFNVPSGARIEIDGRAVEGREVKAPAGRRFVTVTRRGHEPFARELSLERGQKVTVKASLESTTRRKASYYVLGSAAALLIAGGVTTGLALAAQSEANDIRDEIADNQTNITLDDVDDHNDAIDRRNSLRATSYVLVGSALLVGATGALLYWLDNPRAEASSRGPQIVPTVTPQAAGASVIGRF